MEAVSSAGDFVGERIERVIAEYRPRLVAQAQNLCLNQSDAEDLAHETVLRFLARSEHFEQVDEFHCAAWLFKTMRNLFVDRCRLERARPRAEVDPTALSGQGAIPLEAPPARAVYEAIPDEQFTAAIESLSPPLRAAFELHAAGRKYHEIAHTLGIKPGTVGKRISDARARLRKMLEPFARAGVH